MYGCAREHAQVHTHVQKCWIGGLGGESREGELNLTPLKSLKLVRIPETTILLKLLYHILWDFGYQIIIGHGHQDLAL